MNRFLVLFIMELTLLVMLEPTISVTVFQIQVLSE